MPLAIGIAEFWLILLNTTQRLVALNVRIIISSSLPGSHENRESQSLLFQKKKLKEEIPFKSIGFFKFEDSTEKTKKYDPVIA